MDALFNADYEDIEALYPWSILKERKSEYIDLIDMVKERFPEMSDEYLPFALGDLLKEAFAYTHKKEVKKHD